MAQLYILIHTFSFIFFSIIAYHRTLNTLVLYSSVQFSSVQCSVMSDSLRPHESQHARPSLRLTSIESVMPSSHLILGPCFLSILFIMVYICSSQTSSPSPPPSFFGRCVQEQIRRRVNKLNFENTGHLNMRYLNCSSSALLPSSFSFHFIFKLAQFL